MAVQRLIQKVDPVTGQNSQYSRTYLANGSFDASKDVYLGPVYQTTKGDPGASAYQIWLNVGNSGTPQDFLNSQQGQDAKQIAIRANKLPANATDDDYLALVSGKPGKDSTVPGPSNYQRALALGTIPSSMTEQQFLDSQKGPKGDPGTAPKLGLLVAGTTLTKGALHYWTGQSWTPAKPTAHELLQGATAVVDKAGDLIADGFPVDVTGLGFVNGKSYYLTVPDVNGKNLALIPYPAPASLLPSATQSLCTVGQAITQAGVTLLNLKVQTAIDPAAMANYSNAFATDGALGAEWAKGGSYYATSSGTIAVTGGAAKLNLTTGGDALSYLKAGPVADGFVQADLTQGGGLVARYSTNGTGYQLLLQAATSLKGNLYLVKLLAGSPDAVLWNRSTVVTGGTYRLTFSGTTLTVSENGTVVATVTDASYASGFAGIYSQPASTAGIDNFKVAPPPGNLT